jgi:DNA-binding IscR family transcriptional regulator
MKGERFATGQYDSYFGLRVMMTISRSFLKGDGAVSQGDLAGQLDVSHGFVSSILNRLKQKGLLNSVDEGKAYLPARSPARITVQEVLMAVHGDFFRIPSSQRRDEKVIQQLFRQAHKGLQKGFKGISIEALVKG